MPTKIARLLIALAVTVAGFCVATAAPAQAATCNYLWTGAVSTAWDEKNNWSPNTELPSADDVACLTAPGTYTVDLSTGFNHFIGGLVVGGEDAHVTFTLGKTGSSLLYVTDSVTVAAGSRIEIGGPDSLGAELGRWDNATPTFVNNGTITSYRTPKPNDPWGSPVNALSIPGVNNGTIAVTGGRLMVGAGITNNGTFSIDDDAHAWMSFQADQSFTNNGTVANDGIFHLSNSRWVEHGTVTGNPPVLRDGARFDDLGGTGEFQFQHVRFTGTVSAGQTIHVGGGDGGQQTQFDAPATVAPGGKIVATLPDGNNYQFLGEPLTNHGTIDVSSDGGHILELNNTVTNAADGTIALHSGRINANKTFTNSGTFTIAPGALVWKFGTEPFTQAGTITNGGTFIVYNSNWVQQAGATTGNPIIVRDGSTFTDSGGTGAFQFQHVRFSGTVASGQTIHVGGGEGGQTLILDAPSTIANGGRLVGLLDGNGYRIEGAALTNHGEIDVSSKPSEYRILNLVAPLTNAADGTVAVRSGRIDLAGSNELTNHGLITLDPGAGLGLPGNGALLTTAADGTLRFGIAGPESYGAVMRLGSGTMGPIAGSISGSLVGGYEPAAGTEFPVIVTPYGAGTFEAVTGGFTATYADDVISLRAGDATHDSTLSNGAPKKVKRGKKATITTTLTDATADQPLAGRSVTLYKRAKAGKPWTAVKTVETNAAGTAKVSVTMRAKAQFRWGFAGTASYASATSPVRTVKVTGRR